MFKFLIAVGALVVTGIAEHSLLHHPSTLSRATVGVVFTLPFIAAYTAVHFYQKAKKKAAAAARAVRRAPYSYSPSGSQR